jgi:hypothetical protein
VPKAVYLAAGHTLWGIVNIYEIAASVDQPSLILPCQLKIQHDIMENADQLYQPRPPGYTCRHLKGQQAATFSASIAAAFALVFSLHHAAHQPIGGDLHPIPPPGNDGIDNPKR